MDMPRPLTLACIGCGSRAQTYTALAARRPDRFQIVAGADPVAARVEKVRRISGRADFRGFASARSDPGGGKDRRRDDRRHAGQRPLPPLPGACQAGYHVLLEKPISTDVGQVLEIEALARQANRRVMVCFVLRFAAFYRKVKEIIQSGALGEIVSIQANEGVMPWHQAHSFVRGHWSVVGKSSPMIISKCCHDTDIVHWLVGRRCLRVASFGSLEFFRPERAPAGAPPRCTDGCPVGDTCPYNALRYTTDMRAVWLPMVFDRAAEAGVEEIVAWLRTSPWGRCVYRCDNDAVDRQVLAMEFEGGVTGTFTMTAFENGRHIEIYGTRGVLKGGETYHKHFGTHLIVLPARRRAGALHRASRRRRLRTARRRRSGAGQRAVRRDDRPAGRPAGGRPGLDGPQPSHRLRRRGVPRNRPDREYRGVPAGPRKDRIEIRRGRLHAIFV